MANEKRFLGKAQFYDARPRYPQECIDYLTRLLGLNSESVLADIGAGTGILTKPFLDIVGTVYAVEPNDDMFQALQRNLSCSPKIIPLKSTAENTGISSSTCDAVLVGTAFHWFDKDGFRTECNRILRGERLVAILRISNHTDADKELDRIWRHTEEDLQAAKEFFGDGYVEHTQFEYSELFDEERYVNNLLSSATAPLPGEASFEGYAEKCKEVYRKHFGIGVARLPFIVNCFLGRLLA